MPYAITILKLIWLFLKAYVWLITLGIAFIAGAVLGYNKGFKDGNRDMFDRHVERRRKAYFAENLNRDVQ